MRFGERLSERTKQWVCGVCMPAFNSLWVCAPGADSGFFDGGLTNSEDIMLGTKCRWGLGKRCFQYSFMWKKQISKYIKCINDGKVDIPVKKVLWYETWWLIQCLCYSYYLLSGTMYILSFRLFRLHLSSNIHITWLHKLTVPYC